MNSINFNPLRNLPAANSQLKAGDTLVLVGELFNRGYANGLVECAKEKGIRIIQATVGRRDEQDQLRGLNQQELATVPFEVINIPLEAGFDYEAGPNGQTILDLLKTVKLADWANFKVDAIWLEQVRLQSRQRLESAMRQFAQTLSEKVPSGHIYFAHLMAGGVPKSKVVLALLNRTVKGVGEKYFSSQELWSSDLGQVIAANFNEVTAHSFKILIDATQELREQRNNRGEHIFYSAYGYHGTEIFIQAQLKWQTYTPYLQGWAKMELEQIAIQSRRKGIACTVYNCPEILTNSSSIFQGVEVPLYSLIKAFRILAPQSAVTQQIELNCAAKLKEGGSLDQVLEICDTVLMRPAVNRYFDLNQWPSHNEVTQLGLILEASNQLYALHKDEKDLLTAELSEWVLKACGRIMYDHMSTQGEPVVWIGHDMVVRAVTT